MICQIDLVGAILDVLGERFDVVDINVRQVNAVIAAADAICAALARPHVAATPGMGLVAWLASDDTGRSSRYMAHELAALAGIGHAPAVEGCPHPLDPDDFGRCYRLLRAVPEFPRYFGLLTNSSPQWLALCGWWAELEAMYEAELPSGKAPRLYARMKELLS